MWKLGKVEAVPIGAEGLVHEVTVAYKDTPYDPKDWIHRVVNRPASWKKFLMQGSWLKISFKGRRYQTVTSLMKI